MSLLERQLKQEQANRERESAPAAVMGFVLTLCYRSPSGAGL
jgi:hypothetical protein